MFTLRRSSLRCAGGRLVCMRAEHVKTMHIIGILILYHSTSIPLWCTMIKREYIPRCDQAPRPPSIWLIKEVDSHITTNWPMKLIIEFSMHQADIYRNVHAFTFIITISIDLQVHLIVLNMGVEGGRKQAGTIPPICIKF